MKLLVLDVDNTLFDWVDYYVYAYGNMLQHLSKTINIGVDVLASESKVVFESNGSIEYPFVIQELPSVNQFYGSNLDAMLQDCVAPCREVFRKSAVEKLVAYDGVKESLQQIANQKIPMAALTDAPRYVAMWKLNKLGLLNFFDSVYGLSDPKIPTDPIQHRVKVDAGILLKHLRQHNFSYPGKIRILPDEYEKPGIRGLKTVLMDYELDSDLEHRKEVLWVGDNFRKDVLLGKKLGVITAWAEYGTHIPEEKMKRLHSFSPEQNIHKNASIKKELHSKDEMQPDFILKNFSDILQIKF